MTLSASGLEGVVDTLLFAAGCLAIAAAVRWWRTELPKRWIVGHAALVAAFFAVPLATPANQTPVDIAYQFRPWSSQVGPGFAPDNSLLSDIPLQMIPFRTLVRDRLLAGEAPLWAHELGTGQPLLGNAQSAPFAPLHLATLPLPPVRALTVAAAWQMFLGALLVHALLLALRAPPAGPEDPPVASWPVQAGAALGAVAFVLSTYSVAWLYHPLSMVAMFVPGVMLGIVALARGERRALPGLVAVAWALAVSGHPETTAHTALLSAGLGLVLLARGPRIGRLAFVRRAALAAGLAGCLAAPALLPVVEVLPESERMVILKDLGDLPLGVPDLRPAALLPLVQPLAFGSPREGDWDGPANFNEYASHYAGGVVLALALAGALGLRSWRLAAILGLGLVALAAALKAPPVYALVSAIPGLEHAAHARLRVFWVLAVAVVAGVSLPRLVRSRAAAGVAVSGLVAAGAVVAAVPPPSAAGHPRLWWVLALAALATSAVALAAPRLRPLAPAVVLAAVVLELFVLGVRYHALVPGELDLAADDAPEALAWLADRQRSETQPFRVAGEGIALFPNLPAVYGLWGIRGNDPMQPRAASLWVRRRLGADPWLDRRPGRWARQDPGAFRMLGVRYLLTPQRRRLPASDWQPVGRERGGRIWRLRGALPLFYVPEQVAAAADPERAWLAARRIREFGRRSVYLDPVVGSSGDGTLPSTEQAGRVWVREVRPNGFELAASSETGAIVASSVGRTRGWRVAIDGVPGELVTVNSGFVGFRLPPGTHAVSLEYAPAGWRWGWALAGLGLLGCLVLAASAQRPGASAAPQDLDRPALQRLEARGEPGDDGEDGAADQSDDER